MIEEDKIKEARATEDNGIVLDEIDKVSARSDRGGDVSREGKETCCHLLKVQ